MPNHNGDGLLPTMPPAGLSHVRTELKRRRIRTAIPPHPIQANSETTPHGHLSNALVPAHRQVHVPPSPVRVDACGRLRGLHQQEAQQRVALLADVPQPLLVTTGVLAWYHPHVAAFVRAIQLLQTPPSGQRAELVIQSWYAPLALHAAIRNFQSGARRPPSLAGGGSNYASR